MRGAASARQTSGGDGRERSKPGSPSRSSSSPTESQGAGPPRRRASSTPRGWRLSSSSASAICAGLPLIAGGRSSGARVACRTAADAAAAAVLCLAFPVHPPGRGDDPTKSRLPELDAVTVPTLVVQGERDPFGMPPPGPRRDVVTVPGDHSLRAVGDVRIAVAVWLAGVGVA